MCGCGCCQALHIFIARIKQKQNQFMGQTCKFQLLYLSSIFIETFYLKLLHLSYRLYIDDINITQPFQIYNRQRVCSLKIALNKNVPCQTDRLHSCILDQHSFYFHPKNLVINKMIAISCSSLQFCGAQIQIFLLYLCIANKTHCQQFQFAEYCSKIN